ncbi:hypothetical protein FisN_16Lh240 [Fistulifera solaris]|uniref:FAD dependent oxidoreductase domain-containing protein n=1 Tax=Fistulifera solaris TaxID=1519565 RepID=A0A1Z5J6I8_FISSO|nr:hypothetical protein FisN_16Lh240 [Fistulifera solaris]|eukprot:GAX09546.1 hypothetical protein FisN_16Lh240 [Fistulifera solaris]
MSLVPVRQSLSNAYKKAEIIGASGRIGSQFLRLEEESQAIPRGLCPGSCSAEGSPIYIATPSNCWNELYQLTPPHRRSDLVFVGNGLPPKIDDVDNLTLVVPHYGISRPGEKPIPECDENPMLPTYCYGRHASRVQKLLQRDGISVEIVPQYRDIRKIAKLKLLWATCMWLLCHDNAAPLTVSQVHERRALDLQLLVQELWMNALSDDADVDVDAERTVILDYLKKYSFSIATAIPSKALALKEVEDRNGYFWRPNSQPLHEQLLKRVGGGQLLDRVQNAFIEGSAEPHSLWNTISIPHLNMAVYGTQPGTPPPQSVLIIGSGIMGRSIALNLERRGIRNITMVDPSLPNNTQTTKGSWAWINANQKQPDHYRWINQLGMMVWRKDKIVSHLVDWKGSLVKVSSPLEPQFLYGYGAEGPLSINELRQLEPSGNFSSPGCYYYHFRDEGSVDPSAACMALQKAMRQSELHYVSDTVVEYLRDTEGRAIGVMLENGTQIRADVVVVAAGTGTSTLAKIPMQCSPGRIAFARSTGNALRKIIVDTVNESHVLQRRDGTIVAGGGYLQVGGSSGRTDPKWFSKDASSVADALFETADQLTPGTLSEHLFVEEANRPIPQDGLPVTGWVEPGVYVAVTHSGITLAPFLSALVAIEITDGAELAILKPYRALRFQLKE